MPEWVCATCGQLIADAGKGNLIADEHYNDRGELIGFINWRCVHKRTCDPDSGPWHGLDSFTGKHGSRFFRRMRKDGAFAGLPAAEIEDIYRTVVRS